LKNYPKDKKNMPIAHSPPKNAPVLLPDDTFNPKRFKYILRSSAGKGSTFFNHAEKLLIF
jgi:hypothetical protein